MTCAVPYRVTPQGVNHIGKFIDVRFVADLHGWFSYSPRVSTCLKPLAGGMVAVAVVFVAAQAAEFLAIIPKPQKHSGSAFSATSRFPQPSRHVGTRLSQGVFPQNSTANCHLCSEIMGDLYQ